MLLVGVLELSTLIIDFVVQSLNVLAVPHLKVFFCFLCTAQFRTKDLNLIAIVRDDFVEKSVEYTRIFHFELCLRTNCK